MKKGAVGTLFFIFDDLVVLALFQTLCVLGNL